MVGPHQLKEKKTHLVRKKPTHTAHPTYTIALTAHELLPACVICIHECQGDTSQSKSQCTTYSQPYSQPFRERDGFRTLLQHLSESVQSRAAVEEAVHALSWLHEVAGLESVGTSPIVQATLAGLRRMLARPKSRKEPVTADMLKEMVEAAGPDPSLMDVRLLAMCLVAFAGFLRCDELIKLRCSDIEFNTESMVITIVGNKTDQYREGSSLIVARTGTVTCPVGMMERYFAMGGLECTAHEHVFRAISKTKLGVKLRKGGGLSYSRARELLLEKIKSMGYLPPIAMHIPLSPPPPPSLDNTLV